MKKVSAETELWRAARKGDLEKVQDLLANGTNIHAWNDIALGKAAWRGRLDVVRYLLERDGEKADLHASNDYAVRVAALGNRWDVVKYLVEKGADVAADGHLVWCRSALHGDPSTVKCLLEHGVDVHFKNDWALNVAATNGRQEIVVVLVEWIFREEA